MSIGRRIWLASLVAAIVWLGSEMGFYLCYFTYSSIGRYLYPPFLVLAIWPQAILSLLLPARLPDWYYVYAWPIGLAVSFMGWWLFAVLVASVLHFISRWQGKGVPDAKAVAEEPRVGK